MPFDVPHFGSIALRTPKDVEEAEVSLQQHFSEPNLAAGYIYADVILDDGTYERSVEFDVNGIAIRDGALRSLREQPNLFGRIVEESCPLRSRWEGVNQQWSSIQQRIEFAEFHDKKLQIFGLPIPSLLVDLMRSDRWINPPDSKWRSVIPFLKHPVDILDLDDMAFESRWKPGKLPPGWLEMYSSPQSPAKDLPWRDARYSYFIAVNRYIGDDVGVALDYRSTDPSHPRVIASKWTERGHEWELAVPSIEEFVRLLQM